MIAGGRPHPNPPPEGEGIYGVLGGWLIGIWFMEGMAGFGVVGRRRCRGGIGVPRLPRGAGASMRHGQHRRRKQNHRPDASPHGLHRRIRQLEPRLRRHFPRLPLELRRNYLHRPLPQLPPIASYQSTFGGKGYTIVRLTIAGADANAGLFAVITAYAVIRDLGIITPIIISSGASANVGALAGNNGGLMTASYASGGAITVTGPTPKVGGLIG